MRTWGTEGDGLVVHVEAGFAECVPTIGGERAFVRKEAVDEDGVGDEGGSEADGEAVKGGDGNLHQSTMPILDSWRVMGGPAARSSSLTVSVGLICTCVRKIVEGR